MALAVYLEVGAKKVFACAPHWPGWCRAARTEQEAIAALLDYAPRYAAALHTGIRELGLPADAAGVQIVARVQGNATTDFGAPGVAIPADDDPLPQREAARQLGIVEASWTTFEKTAAGAAGTPLRKGPRGGGREVDAIVSHVVEADDAYLRAAGGPTRVGQDEPVDQRWMSIRTALLETAAARARGEPPPRMPRSGKVWPVRYLLRRSAWHALDHAWEIEDRRT